MKEAFQQQAEGQDEMMIGPNGRPVLTPEAAQRKIARDKAKVERKAAERRVRVDKLAIHLRNKLSIYTEAARGPEDGPVASSFKVGTSLAPREGTNGIGKMPSRGGRTARRELRCGALSIHRPRLQGQGGAISSFIPIRPARLVSRCQEHVQYRVGYHVDA